MSEENVEIVRRCYGLLSARDFSAVAELTHPDIVIDLSRNVFNPATYRGRDGVRRWIEAVEEIWKDFQLDPEELIDVGHSLFSCTRISGKGRGSGVEAEMRMFGIWTLREGKVSRVTGGIETGPKPSKPPSGRSSRFGREAAVPRFAWERSAFPTGGVSRPGPMADTHAVPSPLIEFPADDPERALRFWNGVLGAELTPRRGDAGAGWETDGTACGSEFTSAVRAPATPPHCPTSPFPISPLRSSAFRSSAAP